MLTIAQAHVFELVVCGDKYHTVKEVLDFANHEHPNIGSCSWWIADFETKEPSNNNTGECESDPQNKVHWYLRF